MIRFLFWPALVVATQGELLHAYGLTWEVVIGVGGMTLLAWVSRYQDGVKE